MRTGEASTHQERQGAKSTFRTARSALGATNETGNKGVVRCTPLEEQGGASASATAATMAGAASSTVAAETMFARSLAAARSLALIWSLIFWQFKP